MPNTKPRLSLSQKMQRHFVGSPHDQDYVKYCGNKFAKMWNDMLENNAQQRVRHHQALDIYESKLKACEKELCTEKLRNATMTARVEKLCAVKEQLESQVHQMKGELDERSQRQQTLNAKCHTLKSAMRSAIEEQREMFKEYKASYQQTISALRAQNVAHQESTAEAIKQCGIKQRLVMEQVKRVKEESRVQTLALQKEIESLTKDLETKDLELSCEKKAVQALTINSDAQMEIRNAIQALSDQMIQVVEKLNNREDKDAEQERLSEDQHQKLYEKIVEHLQSRKESGCNPDAEVMSALKYLQEDSIPAIQSKIDAMAEDQADIKQTATQIQSEIRNDNDQAWQHLALRADALTQELAGEREANAALNTQVEDKNRELEELALQLYLADDHAHRQEEHARTLSQRLVEIESIQTDARRLKEDMATKSSTITQLEQKLRVKEELLAGKSNDLRDQSLKYIDAVREVKLARQAGEQAVKSIEAQHLQELEKNRTESGKLMAQTKSQCDLLKHQLGEAVAKMTGLEGGRRKTVGYSQSSRLTSHSAKRSFWKQRVEPLTWPLDQSGNKTLRPQAISRPS